MDVAGKNITVLGAARSGLAAARLLARHGATVFLSDQKEMSVDVQQEMAGLGVVTESGGHTDRILKADFCVVSPGVPDTAPPLAKMAETRIPVISEIELAYRFCNGKILAITGSNGKTTTTTLAGHVFSTAGRSAIVGGNIGVAFADFADTMTEADTAILEVSSFQLDHIDRFRPSVSVLLNITPDHLDRYGYSFDAYAQSKARIFENQTKGDVIIYNADDERVADFATNAAHNGGSSLAAISLETEPDEGAFIRKNELFFRFNSTEETLMNLQDVALRGRHNLYNSLAAAVAARVMDIGSEAIRKSLGGFEGVPHRLEFIRQLDNVRYYNDSKATNVNAVWYALESFSEPLVLIAGGRDKGNDYGPLRELVRQKVRVLIGLGEESGHKVLEDLGADVPQTLFAATMEEAVEMAQHVANSGDAVLMSPACASFDLFSNYEHRGDVFRQLVNNLESRSSVVGKIAH